MSDKTTVVLIHGIRTAAWWQNRVASIIESETAATVIPLKYGYFDVLRFLCPFGICRNGPIRRLRKEIEGVREKYRDTRLVVFAHSYGTHALSRILLENPFFAFDRVILCGSIIREDYDWSRVESQIRSPDKRDAIINECGTRDVWPVLARSITWGYGASGTYGFGTFNVRDRFHPLTHSDFFETDFVRTYWLPAVTGAPVAFSDTDKAGQGTPAWFDLLRLPLRWVAALAIPAIAAAVAWPLVFPAPPCPPGEELRAGVCLDVSTLRSRKEIAARISTLLVDIRKTLDLKGGDLFPAMQDYIAGPSEAGWNAVLADTERLFSHVEKSLDDVLDYDAHLVSRDGKIILITSDAQIAVEDKYWKAFNLAREQFKKRITLLGEMRSADGLPSADQVRQWLDDLTRLHDTLESGLGPLVDLLDQA